MTEYRNRTKERLLAGEMAFGFQVRTFRDLELSRAIIATGFDFAFIDLEHTTLDVADASRHALVLAEGGVTPIARIPDGDWQSAAKLIDGGIQGIVVPQVDTPAAARAAVAACKYRPVGERWRSDQSIHFGWAPMASAQALTSALNELLMLVVMIESLEGLENVEAIAATPGVDVISVGTSDLSGALGVGGDYGHPKVLAAWQRVAAAARQHGKGLRLGGVKKPEDIARTYQLGSRMVIAGNDITTLIKGMRADLTHLRQEASGF